MSGHKQRPRVTRPGARKSSGRPDNTDHIGVARVVAETRAAQGLPPKVEDPATLARVARLVLRQPTSQAERAA